MIETSWNLNWDYNGWKPFAPIESSYTQNDWNQTLITRINQISAQINRSSYKGGANAIIMNNQVLKLVKGLAYYDSNTKMLSGRYKIYTDDSITENIIYVYYEDYPMAPLFLEDVRDDDDTKPSETLVIHENSSIYPSYANRTDINIKLVTESLLSGKITILNY